ncbi:hypothetical protein HNQ59_003002 [Chitinivorax tropicus]|uniref:Uncharacterized protein n=1 Tax=Chitinivorax tropicus TaxID=714531 RepID=A0A840MKI3_9PROT|nr:hypothetical protein [Chitinivorax tropicus]
MSLPIFCNSMLLYNEMNVNVILFNLFFVLAMVLPVCHDFFFDFYE